VVQGDGVAGDLAGPDRGMPQADQDAAGLKGGEELLLGPGGRRGGPDVPVQDDPVRLAAGMGGPFHLGAGQRFRVARRRHARGAEVGGRIAVYTLDDLEGAFRLGGEFARASTRSPYSRSMSRSASPSR